MKANSIPLLLAVILVLSPLTIQPAVQAQEAWSEVRDLSVTNWLVAGPFRVYYPAFHLDSRKGYTASDVLEFEQVEISDILPEESSLFMWHDRAFSSWSDIEAGEKGLELKSIPDYSSIAYLGVYIDVSRWTKAKITFNCSQLLKVYLDGEAVGTKRNTENRTVIVPLKMEHGKHLLLVKTVFDPHSQADWKISAYIKLEAGATTSDINLITSPSERMTVKHLLDSVAITDVSLSPDGNLAALSLRKSHPPGDEPETWVEIHEAMEGRLLHTCRGGMKISRVNWAPSGKRYSYTSYDKSGGTIWLADLEAGTSTPLLENIKELGDHVWSPDGTYIIYSVTERADTDQSGIRRFRNLADRQPWWRDRSYLYKLTLQGRIRQRLTTGEFSSYLNSISQDGKKLLFTRSLEDNTERPYSKTELYSLDLRTLEANLLWKGNWFNSAKWDPRGKGILIIGGPSTFGEIGVNITKGTLPNEYDVQAYLFDPETNTAEPLTKNFNPSIDQALWSSLEDCIYFLTTDRSHRHLYRYSLNKKTFTLIDTGVEVLDRIDIASNRPVALYTGSNAAVPQKAFVLDLRRQTYRLLKDPGKESFARVSFGKIEEWTFKNKQNIEIEGRVYYPPDFNPSRKYPCIVYYYGGTSPVSSEFGGRYPKNLWAAQGYVVYVLQPSGAIGFGQNFSAFHVNDWGIIVANEIIDGVKKFLGAHSFVDPKRVGCIGASYGGFITMLLLTQTDIFSAAVAHAGISSISSYWGEGYWGYAYSAYATANSFPWNRKDIYVNQSPLFNADKITTPLLLLHGSEDTNVPPGESTQLFTALKILGKEVEYIQVAGENHHILTYNKRLVWTKTILAWFDRHLKNQPEWWNELYGAR